MRRLLTTTAVSAVVATLGVPFAAAAPQAGPVAVALDLARFSHFAVDSPHGRIYFSGGAGSDALLVTDLTGATVATIPNEAGATSLTLSPDGSTLYAALPDSDAIVAVDTTALTTTVHPTGAGTHPSSLAWAGDKLWFGYGAAGAGNLGSLDPSGTVSLGQAATTFPVAPTLAGTVDPTTRVVAGGTDGAQARLSVFDVSSGHAVEQASRGIPATDMKDLLDSPSSDNVIIPSAVAGNSFYFLPGLTPSPTAQHFDRSVPGAIALSSGNAAAVTQADGSGVPDRIGVVVPHYPGELNNYQLAAGERVADHGLGWSADERTLFAVETDGAGNHPSLLAYHSPLTAPTDSLINNPPRSAKPGQALTFEFHLFSSGDWFDHPVIRFVRHDNATGADTALPTPAFVPCGPADSSCGWFDALDTAPTTGRYTYTLSYAGDARHAPTSQTVTVDVSKVPAFVGIAGPSGTVPLDSPITLVGTVDPDANITSETVHVVRYDIAHPTTPIALPDAAIAANGSFSVTDTPHVGGTVTYAFSYAGDASNQSGTRSVPVQVALNPTTLTLGLDAPTYAYGATAKLTARLGATWRNRTVAIYAQPYVGGPVSLVASGPADANGLLHATYRLTHNTVFRASFAGDDHTAPVNSSQVTGWTYDSVSQCVLGSFTSSAGWHLYHSWVHPRIAATVAPAKPGRAVRFLVQQYANGAWHTVADQQVTLNAASVASLAPSLSRASGTRYRFTVEANEFGAAYDNTKTWGGWTYFRFV